MWQGLFQLTITKSVATFICAVGVWLLVGAAASDTPCITPKPTPPTFFRNQPTYDFTPGPPTASEGCRVYGLFLGLPADNAPWILGLLAGAVGWLGETAYKNKAAS